MPVLILAFTAAARRQRGSPSGQLQAAKATAAGEVGGDICPVQVCTICIARQRSTACKRRPIAPIVNPNPDLKEP